MAQATFRKSSDTRFSKNCYIWISAIDVEKFLVKETVSVILTVRMTMPDLQRYPWNPFLIKYELDIVFVSFGCLFSFMVSLRKWLAYFLFIIKAMVKLTEINTFPSQENDDIFHIFYQIKVSRVSFQIGDYNLCMESHLKLPLTVPLIAQRRSKSRHLFPMFVGTHCIYNFSILHYKTC